MKFSAVVIALAASVLATASATNKMLEAKFFDRKFCRVNAALGPTPLPPFLTTPS